jgi:ABC-type lipoprotein release transport system permease subunit
MLTDSPDPSAFVGLGAIFVLGFALLILATWYSARRARTEPVVRREAAPGG